MFKAAEMFATDVGGWLLTSLPQTSTSSSKAGTDNKNLVCSGAAAVATCRGAAMCQPHRLYRLRRGNKAQNYRQAVTGILPVYHTCNQSALEAGTHGQAPRTTWQFGVTYFALFQRGGAACQSVLDVGTSCEFQSVCNCGCRVRV